MKMMIVECNKKTAIALRDDGTFVKVAQRGYRIGQTLESMPAPRKIGRLPRMAIAAAAAVVLLSGAAFATLEPYSYVTLDVNPSIEYSLNLFDRVLSVTAVNEDAKPIVHALSQENTSFCGLDEMIERTIEQCRTDGYLYQNDKDYVILSVVSRSDHRTDMLSENLKDQNFGDNLISAEIVSTTMEALKEAEQQGTTPGKLALIRRMQKKTGDKKAIETWINMPVREILHAEMVSSETESTVPGSAKFNQPGSRDTSVTADSSEKQGDTGPNKEQTKQSGKQAKADPPVSSKPNQEDLGKKEQLHKNEDEAPTPDSGGDVQVSLPESGENTPPETVRPQPGNAKGKGGESAPGVSSDEAKNAPDVKKPSKSTSGKN